MTTEHASEPFRFGDQLYVVRGRYAHRHGEFIAALSLQRDFCFVQLYTLQGEISRVTDIIPVKFLRRIVFHTRDLAAPADEKPPPQGSRGEGQGSRVSVDTRSAGVPSLPARAGCVAAGQASPGGT